MKLLDFAIRNTTEYVKKMPKDLRKKYGQFFTSKETAIFMAELFDIPSNKTTLKILDAGAGSGILSIALVERLQYFSSIQSIELTCYENDSHIVALLKENLTWVQNNSNINFSYTVRTENYILSQDLEYNEKLGANPLPEKYDLVIGNPPYMKISKDAPEAKSMSDICYGAPNLYFLFAAMGVFNLKNNGEMVNEVVPELKKPSTSLDSTYSGEYDFWYNGIKIEVKASRAVKRKSGDALIIKALSSDSKSGFDMNFQQIKPACCDVFVWIAVWRDKIRYWVLSSDEVSSNQYYSIGQHRGNVGEGQLWLKESNIEDFAEYEVGVRDILSAIEKKAK